ncbi:MAG TPA: BMP family ABC transporter substrate-binding protein [Acidimicrobiia bacterium]|nr:BMP family ABC transporter substrate-binding protein [Acidimicrobiia bacterium]
MLKRRWGVAALFAAFLLVVAACGDDDATTTSAPPTTQAPTTTAAPVTTTMAGDTTTTTDVPARPAGVPDFCLDIKGAYDVEADGTGVNVGLTFDLLGRGDQSFNDAAACGVDWAKALFGVTSTEITPTDAAARATDLQLQAENSQIVIGNGFSFEAAFPEVCENNPFVNFAITDSGMLNFAFDPPEPYCANVRGMVFAEHEGSFLVGVAAALKTQTGKLGFIGGVSGIGLIEKFEAGFIAGARAVNPDIEIVSEYITEFPNFGGFGAPDLGREIALAMYDEGADIIYAAAGLSGSGMFAAAKEFSEAATFPDVPVEKVWGIGVDSDQYLTVDPSQQEYVLTSMNKRVDVAVFYAIADHLTGNFTAGPTEYDLAADGVGYSTSGGFIDDIVDQLEAYKAQIVAGEIVVPVLPEDA